MLDAFGSKMVPLDPCEFRVGNTRHTVSDISALQRLGWTPIVPVEQNVQRYIERTEMQAVYQGFLLAVERVIRQSGVAQTVGLEISFVFEIRLPFCSASSVI